ncbi:hypothetical protein RF11_13700 [Thelohanellus kitauei]|uniref:Uncharacterized protein n=1 Tax=Thelohanellus kitauei TaxID=669202 RepID=A0A0C2MXB7_THEKT|nr:hypothetical protein RF11_13700 [Thelohanellus kitauei]
MWYIILIIVHQKQSLGGSVQKTQEEKVELFMNPRHPTHSVEHRNVIHPNVDGPLSNRKNEINPQNKNKISYQSRKSDKKSFGTEPKSVVDTRINIPHPENSESIIRNQNLAPFGLDNLNAFAPYLIFTVISLSSNFLMILMVCYCVIYQLDPVENDPIEYYYFV